MRSRKQAGFTLVETLVVLAFIVVLLTVTTINLGRPQQVGDISTTVDALLVDLKTQQNLAMFGGTGGGTAAQAYGLFVGTNQYVVFAGSSYNPGAATNLSITMPPSITLSTTLPSAQVVFTKGSGEVQGFVSGSNTITIANSSITHTVTINRFGALTVN